MAGINLAARVVHFTGSASDQDHYPMLLLAIPSEVADRTEFLLGKNPVNPADALASQILKLERAGATVAGMACNTAHAPAIYDRITEKLQDAGSKITLLHVIDETLQVILRKHARGSLIGILGTDGTYQTAIYAAPLKDNGYSLPDPGFAQQHEWIHEAIYHPETGIKATGSQIHPEAVERLSRAVKFYRNAGASLILLACSEVTLAIDRVDCSGMTVVRPMDILAEALIREYKNSITFNR